MTGCTDAQRRAILHDTGPAMVIAGPGSGKTFVITHRIRHLISDLGVSPESILVITFTKAAAKEMQERAIKLAGGDTAPVFGTFHSVFYNILRHSSPTDTGGVVTALQKFRFLRSAVDDAGIETRDYNELIGLLSADISRYKIRLNLSEDFAPSSMGYESFRTVFDSYEKWLAGSRKLDFDDMLIRCHRLLLRNAGVRKSWQEKFRYILVDEFQDIDELQYASVRLLLDKEKNLFIVGDDDQSIYRFRGARPSIMLGFEKDFPEAKRYVLDRNFRCAAQITREAAALIGVNTDRFEKEILPVREGGEVAMPEFESRSQEGDFICGLLGAGKTEADLDSDFAEAKGDGDRRKTDHGSLGSVAILTRTGDGGGYFAGLLSRSGIPCTFKERHADIYSHFIALDICAYFKLSLGICDRRSFLRIMNRPVRYISRQAVGDGVDKGIGIFARLKQYYRLKRDVLRSVEALERQMMVLSGLGPFAGAQYVFRVVGYDNYLCEEGDGKDYEEIKQRILEQLSGFETKEEWIAACGRGNGEEGRGCGDGNSGSNDNGEKEGGVVISTLHASKGLEYDTVFIVDVAEGNIPGKRAVSDEDIEEERRLFYVGMTRARRRLYICRVKSLWGKRAAQSRFVNDILSQRQT